MIIFYELLLLFLITIAGTSYFIDFASWEFRKSLIIETFGSGVLATVVTTFLYQIQKYNEKHDNERLALLFLDKIKLDIVESGQRGHTLWNLSGGKKFYFDNSIINSLFDVFDRNIDQINNFLNYFPNEKLILQSKNLYRLAREGYVCGEKIDNGLYQLVRSENHKRGAISANDPKGIMYIKGKMFSSFDDQSLCKYIEWSSVPDWASQTYNLAISNSSLVSFKAEIENQRKKLVDICEEIMLLSK